MTKIQKTEQEWRAELDPEQYRVLRQKGTEAPFTGEYDHVFEPGTYVCAGCGTELFESDTKYDSGCGWPAFYASKGDAVDTSDPCSPTARHRPVSATASTRRRSSSRRSKAVAQEQVIVVSPDRHELTCDAHVRKQLCAVREREAARRARTSRDQR